MQVRLATDARRICSSSVLSGTVSRSSCKLLADHLRQMMEQARAEGGELKKTKQIA